MVQIRKPYEPVEAILGVQKPKPGAYKKPTFVLEQPCDDGILLYSTLTGEILFCDSYASDDRELMGKWFLLPESENENALIKKVRFLITALYPEKKRLSSALILTTTGCNARCFYCYEKGMKPIDMSPKTADAVADYLISHVGDKKLRLNWFGGEPLYNEPAITRICTRLSESGVPFYSAIISNGYLFHEENADKAVSCWNLKAAQITLDGTEQVYNRTKAFIYEDGRSPFRVVLQNIDNLVNRGIRVQIRLNMDAYNQEDLALLADDLITRYAGTGRVFVYTFLLTESGGPANVKRDAEHRARLYEAEEQLDRKLDAAGMFEDDSLSGPVVNTCMADNAESMVFGPDGTLYKCEHNQYHDPVGSVFEPDEKLDRALIARLKKQAERIPLCADCPLRTECRTLARCPYLETGAETEMCSEPRRAYMIGRRLRAVKNCYLRYKLKGEKDNETEGYFCNGNHQ